MAETDPARKAQLDALRRQIARTASFSTRANGAVPLGIEPIDFCLGGGLARGALHEIAAADHRSIPAALGFLLALTNLAGKACLLWPFAKNATAFGMPYAPGLKSFGLDPARIVFVRCANPFECLWAMEEGLRLGGVSAVIGARVKAMDLTSSRRLQLAAEQANIPVLLLRNYNDNALSAAVTRWRVSPAPSARDEFDFYKKPRFHIALEYARGGKTGEWALEWDHDALLLRLSSALGDRAAGENRAA